MKMVSVHDKLGSMIEAEFAKVCSDEDVVYWSCAPDTIAFIEEDSDGDQCLSRTHSWCVQIVVTNPNDQTPDAHAIAACKMNGITDDDFLIKQIRTIANEMAFERQVHGVLPDV